ncbi:MAG TPA: Gldg family protein [Acidobacteriota bacterium]|nr:Gldg family protein [Acidobacteriota bacterium]
MRKVIESLSYFGLLALAGGLVYYSINNVWDWRAQVLIYGGVALLVVYLVANISRLKEALSGRSGRYGGTALAYLILVVGILVLLNFLNFRHHKRYDLTENRLHALSEQTGKIVRNLDREIEIIGFFQDSAGAARFENLAREYNYLNSKVGYEVVDPQREPGKVTQYEVTRNGQVVVVSGTRREVLDTFSEENLTNALIKLTRDEEKVIYFLEGHGERALDDFEAQGFSTVKEEVEKQNYRVESYNLAQENRIPDDATVIISAGPQVSFFPNEVQLLEEYLEGGGKFMLLVDPDTNFEMNDFLEPYGLSLDDNIVIDASGVGQLLGLGAAAPLVADYGMHPITETLGQTMTFFPRARSLTVSTGSKSFTTAELLRTTARSWGETELDAAEVGFDEGVDKEGPLVLGVVASKSIETEGDEDTESKPDETSDGNETVDADLEDPGADSSSGSLEARLVVIGDSDFATNGYFRSSVNGDLFLNAVSWLAQDTDLISIRPKDPENRTITLTASQSRLIFWATVIFFPLATLFLGVSVWYRRRS